MRVGVDYGGRDSSRTRAASGGRTPGRRARLARFRASQHACFGGGGRGRRDGPSCAVSSSRGRRRRRRCGGGHELGLGGKASTRRGRRKRGEQGNGAGEHGGAEDSVFDHGGSARRAQQRHGARRSWRHGASAVPGTVRKRKRGGDDRGALSGF